MRTVDVAAVSDTGLVREANEDSFLVDLDLFLFAVADGMGGHVAGEIASATAIESIRAQVSQGTDIASAITNAHDAVKNKATTDSELAGMGTTLTAIGFSKNEKLQIAHVGDSRAYLYRKDENVKEDFNRLTKDHSLVEELVELGQITQEEANVHPRRSVITRALGIAGDVEVDTIDIRFKQGDRYLLCSDGLTSMVRDEDIYEVIKADNTPNECAQELVRKANQAGGNDNITVVVIDVIDETLPLPKSSGVAKEAPLRAQQINQHSKKGRFMFTTRIVVVALIILGLGFGAYKTAEHFMTQGYFLDQRNGEVVLMSGKKDSPSFWDPKLDSQTGLEVDNLSPADRLSVERNTSFENRSQALQLIELMRSRQPQREAIELLDPDQPIITQNTVTTTQGTAVTND